MSYRTTPALSVGGVTWLDQGGQPGEIVPPPSGWLCFHCNQRFDTVTKAQWHFGIAPCVPARCTRPA
jgi:hypothetical protein